VFCVTIQKGVFYLIGRKKQKVSEFNKEGSVLWQSYEEIGFLFLVEEAEAKCVLEGNDNRNFLFLFPIVRDCISFPTCEFDSKRSAKKQ
jgi:hypothetical protein